MGSFDERFKELEARVAVLERTSNTIRLVRSRSIKIEHKCGHKRVTGSELPPGSEAERKEIAVRAAQPCSDCQVRQAQKTMKAEAEQAYKDGEVYDSGRRHEELLGPDADKSAEDA